MRNPKYKGNLSKPITPGIIRLAQYGNYENWLKSDQARYQYLNNLLELFELYQIDASTDDCWVQLSLALAEHHVRGLTFAEHYVGRGRPKKNISKEKKERGRPITHTDADQKELFRIVMGKKAQIEKESGKKTNYTEVIRILLRYYAKKSGKSVVRTLNKDLAWYQNRFYKAKNNWQK